MPRDQVALAEAHRLAWTRVRNRMMVIRDDMLNHAFDHGGGQEVIDGCATFLIKERRYEAAREFLAMLIELDRANYAIEHPLPEAPTDAPEYLREGEE